MNEVLTRTENVFRSIFRKADLRLLPHLTATDIPGWDSMNNIRLLVALEKEFAIRITAAEAVRLANVGELLALISAKLS